METYVLIAIVALALVYFLFFRKPAPPKRDERGEDRAAPPAAKAKPGEPALPGAAGVAEPPPRREAAAVPAAGAEAQPERRPSRAAAEPQPPSVRGPDVEVLRRGLARARDSAGFFGRLKSLLGGAKKIDETTAQEIEEVLLTSDVGTTTTEAILRRIRERLDRGELSDADKVWQALRSEATRMLELDGRSGDFVIMHKPTVVLLVGVNGAGKTT